MTKNLEFVLGLIGRIAPKGENGIQHIQCRSWIPPVFITIENIFGKENAARNNFPYSHNILRASLLKLVPHLHCWYCSHDPVLGGQGH